MGRDPKGLIGPISSGKNRQKSLYCRTAIIVSGRDPGNGWLQGQGRLPTALTRIWFPGQDSDLDCLTASYRYQG